MNTQRECFLPFGVAHDPVPLFLPGRSGNGDSPEKGSDPLNARGVNPFPDCPRFQTPSKRAPQGHAGVVV